MASYPHDKSVVEAADIAALRGLALSEADGELVVDVRFALHADGKITPNADGVLPQLRAFFLTDGMSPRLLVPEPAPVVELTAADDGAPEAASVPLPLAPEAADESEDSAGESSKSEASEGAEPEE